MKNLLEVIIKGLVDSKDEVSIEEEITKDIVTLKVKVNQADMGKIIGKQGRMAKCIRSVMRSVANKEHKKINVEFIG